MAYVVNQNQEDEENQNQPPQLSSQGGGVISGMGGGAGALPPSQAAAGTSSGNLFTNLNKYVSKNKEGAAELGGQVAGKIGEKIQSGVQGIGQAGGQVKEQVYSGSPVFNQQATQAVLGNAVKAAPESMAQVQRQLSGQYSGPSNLEDTAGFNTAKSVKAAGEDVLKQAETAVGQRSLISEVQGGNRKAGISKLDQALMQNAPGSRSQLEQAQAQGRQSLGQAFTGFEQAGRQAVQGGQAQAQQVKQQTQNEINRALAARQAEAQQSVKAQGDAVSQQLRDAVRNALAPQFTVNGRVIQDQLDRATQAAMGQINPASARADYTAGLNADQIAQYNALAGLAGVQGVSGTPQNIQDLAQGDIARLGEWLTQQRADQAAFQQQQIDQIKAEGKRLGNIRTQEWLRQNEANDAKRLAEEQARRDRARAEEERINDLFNPGLNSQLL